jgi:GT2 family glycosyltransferase
MNPSKYSLTFACYNSVEYTKKCIDSMVAHGTPLDRLVVVDNQSTDSTRDYLMTLPLGGRIFNQHNLGCGAAWNQGALALQSEWSIIMNNDVLVSPHWIENLIQTAERLNLKVISPALIEGPLDYDFDAFSAKASQTMGMSIAWVASMPFALQYTNRFGWTWATFSRYPNSWVTKIRCSFMS